jgi:hypothetical protein
MTTPVRAFRNAERNGVSALSHRMRLGLAEVGNECPVAAVDATEAPVVWWWRSHGRRSAAALRRNLCLLMSGDCQPVPCSSALGVSVTPLES